MDGCNMNKFARDMRPELLTTKAQKIRVWIDDVDVKVKRRLEERVKIIPTIVKPERALTPQKQTPSKFMPNPNLLNQPDSDVGSGYDLEEEIVICELQPD